jgi:very-short-patch-repair endonuclease
MDIKRFRRLIIEQAGAISRSQALTLGMSLRQVEWRVESGDWIRVLPGVYRLATVPPTPEQGMRAAALWLDNGVLTGVGAAWWWELVPEPPLRWEFQVTNVTRRSQQASVCVLRRWVDPADVTSHRGIAVVARPLAVLRAAVTLERGRRRHGVRFVDRCKQIRAVGAVELQLAFQRNRGTWGTTSMRDILERTGDRAHSDLERLGAKLLTDAGITGFTVNLKIRVSNGRGMEIDIGFKQRKLAIELDGFQYHSSPESHAVDLERQNTLIRHGWTVLRYGPDVLNDDPGRFVREVAEALASDPWDL